MRDFSIFFEVNSNKYKISSGQRLFLDSFYFISISDWSNIKLLHMFLKLLFLASLSVFIQVTLIKSIIIFEQIAISSSSMCARFSTSFHPLQIQPVWIVIWPKKNHTCDIILYINVHIPGLIGSVKTFSSSKPQIWRETIEKYPQVILTRPHSSLHINLNTPFWEPLLTVSYHIHRQIPFWGPSLTVIFRIHQYTPFSDRFMSVSFLSLSISILHYQRRL